MIEILKAGLDKNGGLFIILAVMLLAIYGSHTFSKEERLKASQNIKINLESIHDNSERLHAIEKRVSVNEVYIYHKVDE